MNKKIVIIVGAGPSGLSAAYSLLKLTNDVKPILIEESDAIGGLSRTYFINGNGIDIGPHRFFTKNEKVFNLWKEILPVQNAPAVDDKILNRFVTGNSQSVDPEKSDKVFLRRRRFSRIYYRNHFIEYPIKLNLSTIMSLGIKKTIVAGFSYLKSCFYKLPETNLEAFMINRFGKVLYEIFFEEYTKKVWGTHPSLISAEWGEQRIKKISLRKVLLDALCSSLKLKLKKEISLIDEYYYPKLGSQQMWDLMAEEIKNKGGEIILNSKVVKINLSDEKDCIKSVEYVNTLTNEVNKTDTDIVISSMPVKDLILSITSEVPQQVKAIAENLQYRDFILVNFVLKNINLKNNTKYPTIQNISPDSWIYLQDKGIKAGRLDLMNSFSPYIIRDFKKDILINLEYFCNENDEFWNKQDNEIIEFAINELKNLNIADSKDVSEVHCLRFKKVYPAYFGSYSQFDEVKNYINQINNLYCIGRNGQHKYNNMDHSVLAGIIAAETICNHTDKGCLWDVNSDKEYQEVKFNI